MAALWLGGREDGAGSINPCGLAGCRWGCAVLNYWRRGRIGFYTVKFKARIRVGQWLERVLLRPRWTPLALNSFTVWPWFGPAALRWSRGRKDI